MNASRLRFLSFWSINDTLNLELLTDQLDEMKKAGLEGVVFHPRNYPNVPVYMSAEYLNIVSDVILYAKSIGMTVWIYDENGWPSGTASGQVIARRPDLTCQWVEWASKPGGGHEAVIRSKHAVSSLDPEAAAIFIDITHEGYRRGLAAEAFEYVTGFFTDEVAFLDGYSVSVERGAVPWSGKLPEMYRQRYGEELEPQLPLLFTDGEGSGLVRVRYWELLTDALIEGYYRPVAKWCEANGKLFAGHLKGEENPFLQLTYSGSCFHVLKDLTLPAIDALERYPGNDFFPRMVHSVAVQQGRESCLVEAFGGSGWGVTPEALTNYILWLAGHGLDQVILHLSQYRLNSQAVHDWPPSMPLHLTWREAFSTVLAEIREKASRLPTLQGQPELLIVAPTRGVMATFDPSEAMLINRHNGAGVPDSDSGRISNRFIELVQACHAAGLHYELTEERTVEEIGVIDGGRVTIGRREYRRVLIADGCLWNRDETGRTAEDRMREAGVEFLDRMPREVVTTQNQGELRSNRIVEPDQTSWTVEMPETNLFAVFFDKTVDGKLHAEVETAGLGPQNDVTIVVIDEVKEISINGFVLNGNKSAGKDRIVYPIPQYIFALPGKVSICLEPCDGAEPNPVVFLEGGFRVESLSSFKPKDDRQLMTSGPFRLMPPNAPLAHDLIASGLPFCESPVRIVKTIHLEHGLSAVRLQLTGVQGDAVHISIDGSDIGWCWGPSWLLSVPDGLGAGDHMITVRLVPSTYNVYGPHRHIDGDRHLITPDQYMGIKNFADYPDAPENTLGDVLHFVKWGITGDVRFLLD